MQIAHNVRSFFDFNPTFKTRAVFFFDISKDFGEIWNERLIFKLQSMRISGNILDSMKPFSSERYERILLDEKSSGLKNIKAGVRQS